VLSPLILAVRVIPGVGARVAGLLFLACICASQVWIALGLGARLRASAPG